MLLLNNTSIPVIFIATLLLSSFFLKGLIHFLHKRQMVDLPDERKKHQIPTPTSGGLVFLFFTFISLPIFWNSKSTFWVINCALILGVLGFIDDRYNLSAKVKFAFQILCTIILIWQVGALPLFQSELGWLNEIITFLFVIGFTNSFNLIDGSDGLAGSYATVILIIFSCFFWLTGHLELAIYLIILIGCLIAFLKKNLQPAAIFMGDTGSLFLGFIISFLTIKISQSNIEWEILASQKLSIIVLLNGLLLLPLLDTLRVMIVRINKGISPFKADRSHLHHILQKSGFSANKIVLFFIGVPVLLTLLATLLLMLNHPIVHVLIFQLITSTLLFNSIIYRRIYLHRNKAKNYRKKIKHFSVQNQILSLNKTKQELKNIRYEKDIIT